MGEAGAGTLPKSKSSQAAASEAQSAGGGGGGVVVARMHEQAALSTPPKLGRTSTGGSFKSRAQSRAAQEARWDAGVAGQTKKKKAPAAGGGSKLSAFMSKVPS